MVLAHNLTAMNAQRQFNIVGTSRKKSTEKLSSGYKINRAADDAAGLTISEKMRQQIRGLNQGSDNIQDGISLVQTAEGALNELTDMLHRMTELSIKAYNDTNTREDREAIQAEIDQLISEVDRVSDTTTFNEIPLLKGNPTVEKITHYIATVPHNETISQHSNPAKWLIDHSSTVMNVGTISGRQDANPDDKQIMYQTVFDADKKPIDGTGIGDTSKASYYRGEDIGIQKVDGVNYAHNGAWSGDLSDNSSAKISFSGLVDANDATDLYSKLMALAGTALNVPCGTCQDTYLSVSFSAKTDTWSKSPIYSVNEYGHKLYGGNVVDISEMIKKAEDLIIDHATDEEKTDAEKKDETTELAKGIAKSIRNIAVDKLSSEVSHFDRAMTIGDYDIGIYDYRDAAELGSEIQNIKINYSAYSNYTFQQYSEWDEYSYSNPGIEIACSSNAPEGDIINIDLPNATASAIGITGYSVARYDETIERIYSPEYAEKMEEYEKQYEEYEKEHNAWEKTAHYVDVGEETIYELTYPDRKETVTTKFVMGEMKVKVEVDLGEPVKVPRTIKKREKRYDFDEPTPPDVPEAKPGDITEYKTAVYDPDDLEIINRARSYILAQRSDLGAIQNRLEHSYNNNMNKAENLTASESRIRDTDMATEMVNNTKLSILEQAVTSMMAQANQSTQGVLSLLQ